MAESKVCPMCLIDKPISEYHKLNRGLGKVQSKCKICTSEYKKKRYWSNRDAELAKMTKSRLKPENVIQRKEYYKKNKEKYQERHYKLMSDEQKRKQRRERGRQYEKKNASKIAEKKRLHNKKEEVKARKRELHHKRKQEDIEYILKRRLRFRLRHIIKAVGSYKYKRMSSIELVGCDMQFLKQYIENKFKDGMSWGRISEIDIDHIIPCAIFDLTKLEEQKKCFHYTNLQPMWSGENRKKNSLFNGEYIRKPRTKNKAA